MEPGETPSVSTNASWSWKVCLFISGIVFGSFISGILLNLRPLLGSKFRALLGYQDSDSNNIKDEPLGEEGSRLSQEDSASLHSLDSNVSQGSSLSQQEDSTCDHPPPESKSTMTEGSSSSPREGILAFKDDVNLSRGESLSSQLLQAIKDSRISIVVFSRGYASSTRCLDDLVAIVDCHKEMKQELLPVFYDVDPRDVRYQSGAYEDAFDLHREKFKEEPDKIYKWKSAMTYLANLSGFALRDPAEAEGIERIVEAVRDTLVYKFQSSRSTHKNPESTERRPSLQEFNKYDVFLSLRRTHTPYTFIDYLYHYLTKKGFSTFTSEEETERGDSIPSQDLQVIKDSRILIVVFTRDYADSTCSLEEMATIVDCHRELNQTVIPVFCGVDRRDVQRQTGPYEKAFVSYTKEFKQDPLKVQKWREALKYMTNLQDISLKDWSEIEAIGNIIQIVERLCPKFSRLSSHSPVGIQSSLAMLEKLLKLEDDCVLVLGVWGMGGSGKTTHALALYDRIVQEFEGACFIEDVSQVYRFGGATALQKQVLCQFLNEELSDMYSPFEMSGFLRRRLYGKKILIVLENVDVPRQLESLAINRNMLGNGSRIIITTRDRHILTAYGVDEIYEIPLLNEDEARELFLSACPDVTNDEGYTELIPRVLEYAGGLPLAIRVLASFLRYRNVTFWEDTLNRSRRVPSFEIIKILQISFNGLDQEEKEIFLHIACFFHGKKLDFVKEVLNCCGYFAGIGIHALIDKSLIKNEEEEIHMHDLLQEMGKEIVRQECLGNPASWSRLWRYEDFSFTLKSKNEASEVKAIVLCEDISISKHEDLNIEGLSKMTNLKMLILFHEHFSGKLTSLPNKLRYLLWDGYPFSSLPSFEPYNSLVQLNLPNSRIKRLWHGRQIFPSLERVDLSYSKELMETPNFEGSPSLKRLDFTGCTNLVRVDSSIGLLKELAYLSFRNCCRLVILDLDVGCNYDCKKPETKPDFTGVGLPNLEHLDLGECTSLSTVHYSIGTLKLKFLNLQGCINLVEKPDFSVFLRDEPENEVIDHSQVGIRSNLAVQENPGSSQRLSQEYSASDHAPQKSKSIMTEGSSSSPRAYKYNVHLSFRGDDTCKHFARHLSYRLTEEGILAFKDDVHLDRGESISSEPLQAIKDSRISIVVFSKGYASSTSCLDELVAIVDCHKEEKQELLPIFYDVDPYDVRNQSGPYEDAFDSNRERFKEEPDKIYKWESAMMYLSNISSLILRDRAETEAEGIERIVEAVWDTLVYKFQISRSTDENPGSSQRLQEFYKYDVFLSLTRTRTPYTFIDKLCQYLTEEGFSTFKSDVGSERGESIFSESLLRQAIKNSRILVVVFTSDYADSTICLEELATIVDCHRDLNQTVIPVFCDVHPRDVRRQTGPYEKAFGSYTKEFKQDPHKVQKWREALKYMTNLQRVSLKDGPEIEAIGNIIQTVERLCPKFSRLSSDSPVGIQSSLAVLEKLLKLEDDCVLVLGVWGMGGSGKTTHALALYDRIVQEFEGACFIEGVSHVYKVGGATALQKQILCQVFNEELSDMYSPFEMSGFLRRRLYGKKILIVLDNVDVPRQLELLAINRNMLGNGSRIIITTRDRQILTAYGADAIYEIDLLNDDEACELFLSACSDVTDYEGYTELIPRVLNYADGHPLAIRVLASFLRSRSVTVWEDTLNRLRRVPYFQIIKILQISFDGLHQEEKEIFLHIACFFHGKKLDFVIEVLNCCGFFAGFGIQVLMHKSLIMKNEVEEIRVHDLLQEMGKNIVREECLENPASRSRLWRYEDFSFTLKSTNEASKVKAIVLYEDTSISKHEDLNIEGLSKMTNLELLILYNQHFSGKLTSLPNKLRYLLWDGYPFSSLPSFEPYNRLVQLNLPNSRIKRLWNGSQVFRSLERVDLSYSKFLRETPNFEGSPRLKRLDFTGCRELMEVHPSIGHLKELAYLSFRDCYMLVTLNLDHKCKLSSLKVLDLYSCRHLKKTPDFTGIPNLEHIDLGKCEGLSTVHHSIGNLEKLKFLNVPADIDLPELGGVRIIRTP
ncbi:uncharacterized protein LOC107462388 isoform X2 [Arachis duranensis]|uniref:Uncharacterized protein LOC107462388 isoform X2 n=1 Tax=Arachis duranensis TaxID=130453 RepID=A0A9C6WGE1_ARADU|nr:uncharacterized protein LOC107462388 isoform X2 [Arachis duranensis]